jgi:acyl-CoA synthetase (AMP-forming)/AMP-acid ligase II
MVADSETMRPVPKDNQTTGELLLKGNTLMLGYRKNVVSDSMGSCLDKKSPSPSGVRKLDCTSG